MFGYPPGSNNKKKPPSILDTAPKRSEVSKDYSEKREALVKYLNKLNDRHAEKHKLDMIKTSPELKADQIQRIFDLAEVLQRKIENNPKAREDFNSLLESIKNEYPQVHEAIKVSERDPEAGRRLLAVALAALITMSSAGQVLANNNTPTFIDGANATLTYEGHAKAQDDTYNFMDFVNTGEGVEGGGSEPSVGEGNPITLASAYFETGTVDYKPGAREQAKHAIHVYLTRVDMENGLANSKIIVKGLSSKERGYKFNKILAEQRTAEGMKLVLEVLRDYFNGQEILIETAVESDASIYEDMSTEERLEFEAIAESNPEEFSKLYNQKVDAKQSITVEAVTKVVAPPKFEDPNDYANVSVIFGDRSGTMKDNMGSVELLADKVNEMREPGDLIKIINIEGGNNEQHLQTIIKYLESDEGRSSTGDMFMITDEGLNQLPGEGGEAYVARYKAQVGKILSLVGKRKIVIKFLDPTPNSYRYKVFNLNDKPEGLLRQARPTGVTSESPKFTEEVLNRGLFEKIDRYGDVSDNPEKEAVNDDKTFHSGFKGKKGK